MSMLITIEEMLSLPCDAKIPMECSVCKANFTRIQKSVKSDLKYAPNKKFYCNSKCTQTARKKDQIQLNCFSCGDKFELKRGQYNKRLKLNILPVEKWCCSHSCANKQNIHRTQETKLKISDALKAHNSHLAIDKIILENLIQQGKSTYAIAKELNRGQTAIRYWLTKFGLKTTPARMEKTKQTSTHKICCICKLELPLTLDNFFIKSGKSYSYCRGCHSKQTVERLRLYKLQCIEYKGGQCIKCGYNKHYSALDFHHLDPSKKDFTIGGSNMSFENLKPELDKCVILCSNCHREFHAGLFNLQSNFVNEQTENGGP